MPVQLQNCKNKEEFEKIGDKKYVVTHNIYFLCKDFEEKKNRGHDLEMHWSPRGD